MQKNLFFLFIGLLFWSCSSNSQEPLNTTPTIPNNKSTFAPLAPQTALSTIAFGSCNRQDAPQPIWKTISSHQPNLWIWLGDNIYGDTEDMSVMQAKYNQQMGHPEYQDFISKHPIIGIWDDHDYGTNDGDKRYTKKAESKDLMLDFLNVPDDAPVRNYSGAYQVFDFGPEGQQIKILLLDARSFRDELTKGDTPTGRGYLPNETGDVLGDAQWTWLEQQLKDSKAQIHILACGIQFIPEEHRFEKWANFPTARKRLFDLLATQQVVNPILLSGDRHIAEVSKLSIDGLETPVYEITSSGMTHSYESVGDEPNQHRISPLVGQKNFGLLHIDWSNPQNPGIKAEVRGLDNQLYIEQAIE